jgi:hypothetical protein
MTLGSSGDGSFISKSWSEYQAALQEADELFNRNDGAAADYALDRAMEIADRMSAAPARTLSEAVLKLELALEEVEIAYGDEADPAWARLRQAFNETRVRAAA